MGSDCDQVLMVKSRRLKETREPYRSHMVAQAAPGSHSKKARAFCPRLRVIVIICRQRRTPPTNDPG